MKHRGMFFKKQSNSCYKNGLNSCFRLLILLFVDNATYSFLFLKEHSCDREDEKKKNMYHKC